MPTLFRDKLVNGSVGTTILADNSVTDAKLRDSGPLSVIGRAANSSGDPADISAVAASDAVLRESASTVGWGTVATAGIASKAVTDAKLRDSGLLSVIGRAANSSGVPADISTTAATGAVLRESGSTLGFGTVATAGIADNAITAIKLADSAHGYGQQGMTNGTLSVTAAGSALTVALKTLAGSDPSATDPVDFFFRNATGTTGDFVRLRVTGAASMTISSGSTLGVSSSFGFRVWIVGFNDSSTFRLGVFQSSNRVGNSEQINPLVEGLASSTAEGGAGAADSEGVIYTGTAVSSKPMLVLGYAEWNSSGLTAGTWTTTNLSTVQLYGPGICLPGRVLQKVTAVTSPNANTASATFVITNTTISITPTSAANLIEVLCIAYMQNNTAGDGLDVQWSRGNTNNTNMIGSRAQIVNGAGIINIFNGSCMAFDFPNTTSLQTYGVQYRVVTGGTGFFGGALPIMLTATEYQT